MSAVHRDALRLHVLFAAVAALVLWLPLENFSLGVKLFGLIVAWHAGMLVTGFVRGHRGLLSLWWFATVTSVLMILPDWVLVDGLGTLRFPADGFPDIGPVTAYMAGMWAIAFVVIVLVAEATAGGSDATAGAIVAAVTGAAVFIGAEVYLTSLGVWRAVGVATTQGVAHYIVVPEIILSVAVFRTWKRLPSAVGLAALLPAAGLMVGYTGLAVLGWLIVERIL